MELGRGSIASPGLHTDAPQHNAALSITPSHSYARRRRRLDARRRVPAASFLDVKAIEEVFRRLVLDGLHRAERLSEAFRDRLYPWVHSGFSVFAEQVLQPTEPERLAHLALHDIPKSVVYIARPPVALATIRQSPDGSVLIETPPDPRTGKTEIVMDPLDWIHAILNQIPDPGQHLVRDSGAYALKIRSRRLRREDPLPTAPPPPGTVIDDGVDDGGRPAPSPPRQSWRRLVKKIYEADPLLCPKCRIEMSIVAVITDIPVIDKILNHIRNGGGHDPFDVRAPPPE